MEGVIKKGLLYSFIDRKRERLSVGIVVTKLEWPICINTSIKTSIKLKDDIDRYGFLVWVVSIYFQVVTKSAKKWYLEGGNVPVN